MAKELNCFVNSELNGETPNISEEPFAKHIVDSLADHWKPIFEKAEPSEDRTMDESPLQNLAGEITLGFPIQAIETRFSIILIFEGMSFKTRIEEFANQQIFLKDSPPGGFLNQECTAYLSRNEVREYVEAFCYVDVRETIPHEKDKKACIQILSIGTKEEVTLRNWIEAVEK